MSLLLPLVELNPYVDWCARRLEQQLALGREQADQHKLEIFQNPALYYACLAIKRLGEMSIARQQRMAAKIYKPYTSRAMMRWLSEDAFVGIFPRWLLHGMMGKANLSDDKLEYFHDGAKIWAVHDEAVRTIRRDMATFVNKIPQQGPRTVKQAGDIMNDLNNKMYRDSLKEKTGGNGSEIGVSDGNPPREGSAAETGSPIGAGQGAAEAAQPGESGVGSTAASQNEPLAAALATDGGGTPDDSVEAPPEYMHVNLLTFAMFGMLSDHPDPDLDVSASDGSAPARSERTEGSDMRWPETRAIGSSDVSSSTLSALNDADLVFLIIPASAGKRRHRLRKADEKRRKLLQEAGCSHLW